MFLSETPEQLAIPWVSLVSDKFDLRPSPDSSFHLKLFLL